MRNKLISTILSVITPMAVLASANDFPGDRLVSFSSPGPDRYADGTIVPDGECYALVWTPSGKAFSGFNADGTAASALDRVILAGPLALDGKCRDSIFQVPKAEYDALEGGTWSVCLVDTRRANGVPAGVKDGKPVRVNRWGLVNGGVSIKPASASAFSPTGGTRLLASAASATSRGAGVRAANLSTVPAGTQAPTITGMEMADGVVTLSVADTVPWLRYTIESGSRLGTFAIDGWADKVDGDSASEIVIETESTSPSRFFRVIRAE
jgi:hypothetical protein